MFKLDRSECTRVEVKTAESSKWKERIALYEGDKGVVTVHSHDEKAFLSGTPMNQISVCQYPIWREIKKPEWKPFEKGEDLLPYIDCWFRYKTQKTYLRKPVEFDIEEGTVVLGITTYDLEKLFHGYEMRIGGEWHPVGYLSGSESAGKES